MEDTKRVRKVFAIARNNVTLLLVKVFDKNKYSFYKPHKLCCYYRLYKRQIRFR